MSDCAALPDDYVHGGRHCSALAAFLLNYTSVLSQGHVATARCSGSAWPAGRAVALLILRRRSFLSLLRLLAHDLLVQFLATARENLLHVLAGLSRGLEALVDVVLARELDSSVEIDFSGGLKLAFVADQVYPDVLGRVLLDLLQPASQVLERLVPRDVVSQEDAVGSAVKNPSHRLERLLTSLHRNKIDNQIVTTSVDIKNIKYIFSGSSADTPACWARVRRRTSCVQGVVGTYSVPDLQFDDLVVDLEAVGAELDSNRHLVLLLEFVVHDAFHQTGLANARVPDNDQLKQVILSRQSSVREHFKGDLLDLFDLTLLHFLRVCLATSSGFWKLIFETQ